MRYGPDGVAERFSTETRYKIAKVLAHGGWWGAFMLLATHIALGGAKPVGDAPPWLGLIVIFCIGVGIAAGQALGRMRLTRAITKAFDVGYQISDRDQMEEVRQRQEQIITKLDKAEDDRLALVRDLQKEISNR